MSQAVNVFNTNQTILQHKVGDLLFQRNLISFTNNVKLKIRHLLESVGSVRL